MTALTQVLRPGPAPLITHYDLSTGERVELSATTAANWVAKTAGFLTLDLDAEPDTRVRLGLPTHWLRFVWLLACWNAGAAVVDAGADIAVSGPDLVANEEVKVACSLLPLGARFRIPPEGFLDMAAEVPGHSDVFVPFDPPCDTTLAIDLGGRALTHAQLVAAVEPSSERLLLCPGSLTRDLEALLSACLGGGSLVTVVGATEADLHRIAEQERTYGR